MSIFYRYPPSMTVCAVMAVILTLWVGVFAGLLVTVAWWTGHKLDTY